MKKFLLLATIIVVVSTEIKAQYNTQLLGKKTYPAQSMSSIWGYTDISNGKKYAIIGTSKGTSIVDISIPSAPTEVAFASGLNGSWREVKVYNKHAYISHDNTPSDTLNSEGVLIIDLSNLPNSIKVDSFNRDNLNNRIVRTHSLFIDEKGFLYLNGGRTYINNTGQNGCAIYDLKNNPKKPQFVGYTPSAAGTQPNYVHDCYVRNDTLYESNIYAGRLSIYDVRNKSNPTLITYFNTPFNFTHNSWLSDNGKTIFTTDEKASAPIGVYDIHDINNPVDLGQLKSSPTETAIPHNVHVWNDYLIVPHYTLGVVIWDVLDPTNIVKIGYYDTNNYSGGNFNGVWGAYPYFADSTLILSDIEGGLFVLKPTYKRAARIQGVVTDTNTTQVLAGVKISFADTANYVLTSVDGIYKTGSVKPGLTRFKAEKTGYVTKYFYATLVNGSTITTDVKLRQTPIEVKISAEFCENKSYTLPDGSKVIEPGIYYTNYVLPSGKDSIIKTTLTELPASYTSKTVHLCDGDSYQLPDGNFTSAEGTYYDTLQNVISCDSIITTIIFKHPEYAIFKQDSFNLGDTYTLPNGNTTTTGGTFVNNLLTAVYGCDSVITVDLKVASLTGIRNNINDIQLKFIVNNNTLQLIRKANILLKELQLYNALGEMVKAYANPENTLYLPVLPKGIYIIRALSGDNEEYTGKISLF